MRPQITVSLSILVLLLTTNSAIAQAVEVAPPDRQELIITAPLVHPPSEWERMRWHDAELGRFQAQFSPDPPAFTAPAQAISNRDDQSPPSQREPIWLRAMRERADCDETIARTQPMPPDPPER